MISALPPADRQPFLAFCVSFVDFVVVKGFGCSINIPTLIREQETGNKKEKNGP